MGNTVVWKPAATRDPGRLLHLQLLEAAGLPPGVINFVPGDPIEISEHAARLTPISAACTSPGSTGVFNSMWQSVGQNTRPATGRYPRLVGETGGKDFIVVHPSADPQEVAVAVVRGAFEYQGQKCSAASRMYVPQSLWPDVRDRMVGDDAARSAWATCATSATSWAR